MIVHPTGFNHSAEKALERVAYVKLNASICPECETKRPRSCLSLHGDAWVGQSSRRRTRCSGIAQLSTQLLKRTSRQGSVNGILSLLMPVTFGFLFSILYTNFLRVWSWLRTNPGGMLNTCKSDGVWSNSYWVADGWVTRKNLPWSVV